MQKERQQKVELDQKKAWESPKLAYLGDVEELVQGGGGKVSITSADPGEPKKTRPSEP